jgi:IclR family pca regulon transcriptional regulator
MKKRLDSQKSSAGSLTRCLLVLECFSPQEDSFTLSDLAKHLGIPKSSLHRVVKTLSQMNYLRYEEQSKRYYLGMRVLSLGFSVLQSLELREIARPYLERLSRECNKTVNLAILDKHEMVYVERVRVPGLREFNISIGNRIPVWSTAVGKAVLAHLEPEELKRLVKQLRLRPEFKVAESKLGKTLDQVRRDGFAINDQEFLRGIRAVAVPIFSPDGVNCAINIVVEPEEVSIDELRKYYAPKLIRVGKELSRALGCSS